MTPSRRYLGKPDLAERYGRTVKTIERWEKLKILPGPDLILSNRKFWDEATLDQHDAKQTALQTGSKDEKGSKQ